MKIDRFKQFKLNENKESKLLDLWNTYIAVVDGIDGIISEHGELSNSYWKDGVDKEITNIVTDLVETIKDVENYKGRIVQNSKDLLDGLDRAIGSGKYSEDRYFETGCINRLKALVGVV